MKSPKKDLTRLRWRCQQGHRPFWRLRETEQFNPGKPHYSAVGRFWQGSACVPPALVSSVSIFRTTSYSRQTSPPLPPPGRRHPCNPVIPGGRPDIPGRSPHLRVLDLSTFAEAPLLCVMDHFHRIRDEAGDLPGRGHPSADHHTIDSGDRKSTRLNSSH